MITSSTMTMASHRTSKISAWCALLFVGFFLLYQLSLALHPTTFPSKPPGNPYVFFGADNMEFVSRDMYKSGTLHIVITKHPLFIITLPLYDAASKLYAWVPGFLQHNLIVAFPFALLGACNISVSFWTFMRNYANWQAALGFA